MAFRVLGKFGGGNRKMMIEPQAIEYLDTENPGQCITVHFPEHKQSIALPIAKVIRVIITYVHTQCQMLDSAQNAAALRSLKRRSTL